jgi:hypothetical protein
MKLTKSQLREIIRNEIKSLNEDRGEYISSINLSYIIASLEKSKLLDSNIISSLKSRNQYNVIKILMKNADVIYKSLKQNGRDYLDSIHYRILLDKFKRLISGESKFIDY